MNRDEDNEKNCQIELEIIDGNNGNKDRGEPDIESEPDIELSKSISSRSYRQRNRPRYISDFIDELSKESISLANRSKIKSYVYRFINGLLVSIIIILGLVIVILSLTGDMVGYTDIMLYATACIGAVISAIQSLISVFSIGKKSSKYMRMYHEAMKISRKSKVLEYSDLTDVKLTIKILSYFDKLGILELSEFKGNNYDSMIVKSEKLYTNSHPDDNKYFNLA